MFFEQCYVIWKKSIRKPRACEPREDRSHCFDHPPCCHFIARLLARLFVGVTGSYELWRLHLKRESTKRKLAKFETLPSARIDTVRLYTQRNPHGNIHQDRISMPYRIYVLNGPNSITDPIEIYITKMLHYTYCVPGISKFVASLALRRPTSGFYGKWSFFLCNR